MRVYVYYEVPEYGEMQALDSVAQVCMDHMMQKHKYKVKWQLRSLEDEINADGGLIIVNETGRIELKEFSSQELVDKITELLVADRED